MKPRKTTYLLHRWLGLLVCLQLLAWSAGGLVFSILDIEAVRGETDAVLAPAPIPSVEALGIDPASAQRIALDAGLPAQQLSQIILRDQGLGPRYELYDLEDAPVGAVDARTGALIERISSADAQAVALADFIPDADVIQTTLIESEPVGEFRGKRAPAWRVDLDHPKQPHIYVDAITGEVLARRNRIWRIFDFFWMLHIMDYKNRDNFNHPLLTGFSLLAFLTAASGVGLWGWRAGSRWRRRRSNHAPPIRAGGVEPPTS